MEKKSIIRNVKSAYNEEAVKAHCAAKIKETRLLSGLSQDEISFLLCTSVSSYKKYEAGKVLPPTCFLWRISEFSGEPIDYYLRDCGDEEKCWATIVATGTTGMLNMMGRLIGYFGSDRFREMINSIFKGEK